LKTSLGNWRHLGYFQDMKVIFKTWRTNSDWGQSLATKLCQLRICAVARLWVPVTNLCRGFQPLFCAVTASHVSVPWMPMTNLFSECQAVTWTREVTAGQSLTYASTASCKSLPWLPATNSCSDCQSRNWACGKSQNLVTKFGGGPGPPSPRRRRDFIVCIKKFKTRFTVFQTFWRHEGQIHSFADKSQKLKTSLGKFKTCRLFARHERQIQIICRQISGIQFPNKNLEWWVAWTLTQWDSVSTGSESGSRDCRWANNLIPGGLAGALNIGSLVLTKVRCGYCITFSLLQCKTETVYDQVQIKNGEGRFSN